MKKTNLVLGFMLIMLLAMSTNLMAQTSTPPTNYATSTGLSGDPYFISSLDNLYWLSQTSADWDKYYEQTTDIDATATSGWDGGAGFSPIGGATEFTGSYNGQNYTIDGLFINRPSTSRIGLFGRVRFASGISNLGLTNINITGTTRVGGLVGDNSESSINNCYTTGSVTSNGNSDVGGLIGRYTADYPSTSFSNCYSRCNVSGILNDRIGGLIGEVAGGSINNSYTAGSVSGKGNIGGFVGETTGGSIYNCYSTSSVTFTDGSIAGGFVGYNQIGMINNCYSNGSVTGNSTWVGGFCGYNDRVIDNSFWDTQTSGQSTSSGATGKTTTEMTTLSTFTDAGWDFYGESINGSDEIWNIGNERNDGYPYLKWEYPSDPPLPVNLSSFYALYISGTPTLYWTTQTETDNAYWNVYRGTNDSFEEAALINANNPVPGNGTTNSSSDYIYTDVMPVVQNTTYWYWIEDVSTDGETKVHEPITLSIPFEDTPVTPDFYGLHQNYPNPFNPRTSISFALDTESDVELIIYNIKGEKIKSIFNDHIYADQITTAVWDGKDANGKQVSTGVYFYKLITDTKEYQKKMLMVK